MKYLLALNGTQQGYDVMTGKSPSQPAWTSEDISAMYAFMEAFNKELVESGEWVDGQGLAEPRLARRVQLDSKGTPLVTDGPYSETKEVIAGYWVVDVDGIERATELAVRISQCPIPGGKPDPDFCLDIRQIDQG